MPAKGRMYSVRGKFSARSRPLIRTLTLACAAAIVSCDAHPGSRFRLQVDSSNGSSSAGGSTSLSMETGQTRILEMYVIGTASGPITFSGTDLPSFVTLEGPLLTIAPSRADAGEYRLQVTASDGRESQTAELALSVHRSNTAPRWSGLVLFTDDDGTHVGWNVCPYPATCTAAGTAVMQFYLCDEDRDSINLEVEVVPRGTPFSHRATHSVSVRPDGCALVSIPLSGLAVEGSYDFGFRFSDEFGAVGVVPDGYGSQEPDGWDHPGWGFDQGPCVNRRCACIPSGAHGCLKGTECCSGTCNVAGPYDAACQ